MKHAMNSEQEFEQLEQKQILKELKIKLIVSICFTSILMIGAMVSGVPSLLRNGWFMWLLATPVQFWVGWRYYTSSWWAIKHRMLNMDVLIALGTSVAYFYSTAILLFPHFFKGQSDHVYFESSTAIITFILLGAYLEIKAKGKTSSAIRKLIGLQPKYATVKQDDSWKQMNITDVQVGDIILIRAGETIPVDGIITSGSSSINEAMITGESMPVHKKKGDSVVGATINESGSFEMKATKVGTETMLARIIKLVRQAQASQAPVQRLVDKISAIFIPIVIAISILSFFIWLFVGPEPRLTYAIVAMVSVLIIACPCALGLATPTSIMVGMGRGADEGILIKDVQTLEVASSINCVVFDKTGTITEGKPSVQGFSIYSKELPKERIIALVAVLEQHSDHPMSQAISNFLKKEYNTLPDLPVTQTETLLGLGIQGIVDGSKIVIGSEQLMQKNKIEITKEVIKCAQDWEHEAKSSSYIAIDGKLVALFCVADTIRPNVKNTITELDKLGIHTVMLTGDNEQVARVVVKKVGIKNFYAKVLPADKEKYIRDIQKKRDIVAMIGDGINDAPALAAADVGIAIGSGTDIAIETAGVTFLRPDIALLITLIRLSRATLRNIKQNLVWAFGYNIVLIPVAMGILYPFFGIIINPMFAGVAMAFSSISVVLNALRLQRVTLSK